MSFSKLISWKIRLNKTKLKTCYNPWLHVLIVSKSCFCLITIRLKTKKIAKFRIENLTPVPQQLNTTSVAHQNWVEKKTSVWRNATTIRNQDFSVAALMSKFLIQGPAPQHSQTEILVLHHSFPNHIFWLFFIILLDEYYVYG